MDAEAHWFGLSIDVAFIQAQLSTRPISSYIFPNFKEQSRIGKKRSRLSCSDEVMHVDFTLKDGPPCNVNVTSVGAPKVIRSVSVDTPWLILLDCPDKGQGWKQNM